MLNVKEVDLTKVDGDKRFAILSAFLTVRPIIQLKADDDDSIVRIFELCQLLSYPFKESVGEDGVTTFEIRRKKDLPKDLPSSMTDVTVPFKPEKIASKLGTPTILTSFIPELVSVRRVAPKSYMFKIKTYGEIPFVIYKVKTPTPRYIIRYFGYDTKLFGQFLLRIEFVISKAKGGSRVVMTETYKRAFGAEGAIRKHLSLFRDKMSSVLF
ncbi:hypothetical protein [Sulfolobus acidocaldarius]|uniref:Conserved protein n=4 Tax=Sulfolobus acidocaldarius TaxID=2285 RepID=Q4J893_SULAC|nr:hypothetical protein [Sulfolobus acidocaldarius]AAY80988.1 conserved protein [Sulfolobus acidocaldarius DSM 639]AGE71589.1 hypothetical protein SacN8_08145 [Sulfolobus acidocaldarius N8]AGE73862.1 hypothetical protein SacRon12I_08155 [Sulfolobus acidocaldarius Ron12/I]ALU30187.1 hypothetical protein ATY89_09730 [Sulfolobus acidocaldarius]ALU30902.1 hypothetical protein ATZ20_01285 [Sulfolobus acidocaldarius]